MAVPNYLHRDVVVAAASAGKHIICEKPLARTLAEADEMIAACDEAGVCSSCTPRSSASRPSTYERRSSSMRARLDACSWCSRGEQHFGPHSDWFWDVERSGGGVLMDMGCHGVEFCRWIYDKPAVESVTAELGTYVHSDRSTVRTTGLPRFGSRATGSGWSRRVGQARGHG